MMGMKQIANVLGGSLGEVGETLNAVLEEQKRQTRLLERILLKGENIADKEDEPMDGMAS